MNTIEQSSIDLAPDQSQPHDASDSQRSESKISGFDGVARSTFKEPSLYLSIAIVFVATWVCLGKTPLVFLLSFATLTAVAVLFHLAAERMIFRSKKEFDCFTAPFEGVFVVTFGSAIPGLALLGYGIYALSTAKHANVLEECGKLLLLLAVPLFNLIVWSAVRKRYLIRPRLIGLMNGLALGFSACWTLIWLKSVFFAQSGAVCKFGWMLLLFTSPFLLFAAVRLSLDLWRKTEENIGRITAVFSVLGGLLSLLFVFAPMARGFFVQSLLWDTRHGDQTQQARAIPLLRTLTTEEDLRPSKHPVSGYALASMLIPDRGLDAGTDADQDAYFKLTGKSYFDTELKNDSSDSEQQQTNSVVGRKVLGLSLAKSQITGSLDASTLSSSLDWTMTFHNASIAPQEARSEIVVPRGAVVSRSTLWIMGEAREGAFANSASATALNREVITQAMAPLFVTMSAPDRVLIQCYPIPANGGEMKVSIGFSVPLETTDGENCSMELPKVVASNFAQPKRHRINLTTKDLPAQNIVAMTSKTDGDGYTLTGVIKQADRNVTAGPVIVKRTAPFREFATPDSVTRGKRFVVERMTEVATPAPTRLYVVIDSSGSLKNDASKIKEVLSTIPLSLKPNVYIAAERDAESTGQSELTALTLEQAKNAITPTTFIGGQDNGPALREVIETAAEELNGAVLWIHGPQPVAPKVSESRGLDLVHNVRLYDMQLASGPNAVLQALRSEDSSNQINCEVVPQEAIASDLKKFASGWTQESKRLEVRRSLAANPPQMLVISDQSTSDRLTSLWAKDEVARLVANAQHKQALDLATKYHLVSVVSGAVVLENANAHRHTLADPGARTIENSQTAPMGSGMVGAPIGCAMVGAPIDFRYGQSNEVGQWADFGYDTARDTCRLMSAISLFIAIFVAVAFLRGRTTITQVDKLKATALVVAVPTIVHLMGTFMINNFGGLGGGL